MVMRIRELRRKAGLTQVELADSMGVAQNSVCGWETEVALPRSRELPALARVLGCSIEELYTEEVMNCG